MAWLFSYGSNSPPRLAERLGREDFAVAAAWAPGQQRAFRGHSRTWGGGVATLVPVRGATTYGYVADVTAADLRALDRYEGVAAGCYRRKTITVETHGGPRKAIAYVHTSSEFGAPTRAYLDAVARTIASFWAGAGSKPVTAKDIPIR